jgi:regulator of sigma E protease
MQNEFWFAVPFLNETAQVAAQNGGNLFVTIAAFLLMLGILVVVHELGHFLTAVWMGIKVEEFGIGYPPRMLTFYERDGVRYTLNWLPIGGFVRFGGEDDTVYGVGSLAAATPWRKILVMVAGPLMNLLLAIAIFAIFAATVGIARPTGTQTIAEVYPGSPAAVAGLQAGDELVELGGVPMDDSNALVELARSSAGETLTAVVLRDGQTQTIDVVPGRWIADGEERIGLGIGFGPTRELIQSANPIEAVAMGTEHTFDLLGQMLQALANLPAAIASIFQPDAASTEQPVGPVGIARATGEVIQSDGGWLAFWSLTAILSLNLFLLNLLPVPALDGSHIIFSLVEWLRGGKKVPPEKEALVHAFGFMALMGLMLIITVNDVIKAFQGTPVLGGG